MLKAARATFLQRFIIVNGESLEKKNIKSRFNDAKKNRPTTLHVKGIVDSLIRQEGSGVQI